MSNWEEKFIEATIAFSVFLKIGSTMLENVAKEPNRKAANHLLDEILKGCKDFKKVLDELPVRELTPQEYEAKLAEGKKISFAKEGERMKNNPEGEA